MKKHNLYKTGLTAILFALYGGLFTACSETEFDAKYIDESQFEVSADQMGYLADIDGRTEFSSFEIQAGTSKDVTLLLKATKPSSSVSEVTLTYDEEVLKRYNEETENDFTAFPSGNVLLSAGGAMTLPENTQVSEGLKVSFTTTEEMEAGKTYVIPLQAKVTQGSLKFSEKSSSYLIFVKLLENLGDNFKGENAVKLFSVIETNETNPLNHLCFTLKDSKKYLFDYVVLFCDNIVLDQETGTVHALHNDNIVKILNNKDKYLKPLQDRGMKIILGIMADHTHASIANLKPETAQVFARYMKTVCDTYGLDGFFYDDEYDNPQVPTPPGFWATKSPEYAARLMYEMKRIMPDKINIAYILGNLRDMSSEGCVIDGNAVKDYVDYVMCDYNDRNIEIAPIYPGIDKTRWGMYSQEFNRGFWAKDEYLQEIKDEQYAHFIFAMDPFRSSFNTPIGSNIYQTQQDALQKIGQILYGEDVVYDGKPYPKDF